MILIKQVGVFLNFAHWRFKQFLTSYFIKNGFDITPEQFLVLDMLWKEDHISQQILAGKLYKDKNSVTKLLDQLEKRGLLYREPDKEDRRLNLIVLTPEGKSIEERFTVIATNGVNQIVKDIPEKDLDTFVKVLNKMTDNMVENQG